MCSEHDPSFDTINDVNLFKSYVKALDFRQSIEDDNPPFRERYLVISNSNLFLFNLFGNQTKLIAVADLNKKKKKDLHHQIVIPKDYSKDTGCFILNCDLVYQSEEAKTKEQKQKLPKTSYLFYQIVHTDLQGQRRHS